MIDSRQLPKCHVCGGHSMLYSSGDKWHVGCTTVVVDEHSAEGPAFVCATDNLTVTPPASTPLEAIGMWVNKIVEFKMRSAEQHHAPQAA